MPNGADCCQIAWDAWRQIRAAELPFARVARPGRNASLQGRGRGASNLSAWGDHRSGIGSGAAWLHHKHNPSSPTQRMVTPLGLRELSASSVTTGISPPRQWGVSLHAQKPTGASVGRSPPYAEARGQPVHQRRLPTRTKRATGLARAPMLRNHLHSCLFQCLMRNFDGTGKPAITKSSQLGTALRPFARILRIGHTSSNGKTA